MSFRQCYKLVTKQAIRWFPGHMGKGLKQMQQKLKSVDCILEVHDARIPFSGRNPEFQHTIAGGGVKPHILVLNKMDLISPKDQRYIRDALKDKEQLDHVIFTNCKDQQCSGIRKLMPLANDLIGKSGRYNREGEKDYCVMVIGVPNVGKSSLLNVLRNRHLKRKSVSQVGGIAGVTRSVLEKIKISEDPLIYMIDTPGILEPKISSDEMGMKLALVGCLQDHLVGEDLIADYLLYWLNKNERFEYVPLMGLENPNDDISEVLVAYANKQGVQRKLKGADGQILMIPDILHAARHFIKLFRTKAFGNINLDKEI
ncbi:mitochondrial GTPase 1 [Stomoxys calcitrans]|uniref:mitochondrial GTPase 1 n=1 Tax=Stomoxys calcitrans TaxID=35570 RepID=UPI0027E396FA|nr:mitochondrial GTPase 1 [Stomoxys calcitrans]